MDPKSTPYCLPFNKTVLLDWPGGSYARTMTESDDSTLMHAYAAGDLKAFEQLYRRHKDTVFRFVLRLSNDSALAEDIAQEVWIKVIGYRDRYSADAKFTTLLYRIAHNAFIDHTRRRKLKLVADSEKVIETLAHSDEPDKTVQKDELAVAYRTALSELPPDQRDAYLLRAEAGLSLQEIAEVTGAQAEAVKSRLRYAGKRLKQTLLETLQSEVSDA